MATGLTVRHVGRQHQYGNRGDGEPQNDDEFGEVGLVLVVGVLVIDEQVDIEDEDDDAEDNGDDDEREVEIAHRVLSSRFESNRIGEIKRGLRN